MPKSNQIPPTPVRLPADLKAWVKGLAAANVRSVNAEIICLLRTAHDQAKQAGKQPAK
jgi:hypothetical protein